MRLPRRSPCSLSKHLHTCQLVQTTTWPRKSSHRGGTIVFTKGLTSGLESRTQARKLRLYWSCSSLSSQHTTQCLCKLQYWRPFIYFTISGICPRSHHFCTTYCRFLAITWGWRDIIILYQMKKAKLREEKQLNAIEVTCSRVVEPKCYQACTPRCYLALSTICTKDAGSKTPALGCVRQQSVQAFLPQTVPRSPMVITS